jgi:hypothetical protein
MERGRRAAVEVAIEVVVLLAVIAAGAFRPMPGEAQRGARIGQPAPEIAGGPWINSEPLSLAGLRGRVVFVEFWTYG